MAADAVRKHEAEATQLRPLAIFAAGLALLIVVAIVVAYFLLHFFLAQRIEEVRQTQRPVAALPIGPPGPRLQTHAPQDLAAYERAEGETLDTYGWVDRANGRVRLPIARAMQLLAERGLPKGGRTPEEIPR